jgi:threonine 3-dehydrogenase
MNTLITGGSGNLGSRLLVPLVRRGDAVMIFDLQNTPMIPSSEHDACRFVRGDLCDRESLERTVREGEIKTIFHLGAILSAQAEKDPDLAWRVNMDGIRNVLEVARTGGVEKVIFSSTLATYGGGLPAPLDIDSPMWPASLYGATKVAAEVLGNYYHLRFGLDFRAIRFPSLIAARGAPGGAGRFTSEIFTESVKNGRYEFYLEPESSIPIVYIDDAIDAILTLHDADSSKLTRRAYNIHARGVSARQLELVVRERLPGVQISYNPDPVQTAIVNSWPASIDDSHARTDWGWQPVYTLEEMADRVIKDLRGEPR